MEIPLQMDQLILLPGNEQIINKFISLRERLVAILPHSEYTSRPAVDIVLLRKSQ